MISISVMHKPGRPVHPALTRLNAEWHKTGTLWECARSAWLSGAGTEGHHLVLHDDIEPCEGFLHQVTQAVAAHPWAIHCLWGSRLEPDMPPEGGFLAYQTFCWGGAILMPRSWISAFIRFCDVNIKPEWIMDDTRITLWACHTGRKIYVPRPNLVQHGYLPSTVRHRPDTFRSKTFRRDPGVVPWGAGTVVVPGDAQAFIISRRMHYVDNP